MLIDDDVLDVKRLVEAYDDDIGSIAKLLGMARETERRYIKNLRDSLNTGNVAGVAGAAHSIKGSASNIGASRVSKVAARIEDQARRNVLEGVGALADELDDEYRDLCARIAAYAAAVP